MRRVILIALAVVLAPLASARAQTVTTSDIINLAKAGLTEEVLLALIEVHRPVFPVDTVTLKSLKDAGVPPAVIVAMIRSGREMAPAEPVPVVQSTPVVTPVQAPPPQVVVVERQVEVPPVRDERPRVREVVVPVYVPVPSRPIVRPKPVEPVYWGFGGKLRPDAWKPTPTDVQKDAKVPRQPQNK